MRRNVRIMLVDDDTEDIIVVRELVKSFTELNVSLDWHSDIQTAQETILKNEYDIYLIDYRLGPHSGLDLIRDALANGVDMPFVLLTGFDAIDVDREAMEIGAAEFLPKGELTAPTLERVIRHTIDRFAVTQELRRANNDKSMFLARMSHEIRTPLTGIMGVAALLQETDLTQQQTELVQLMDRSSKALLELINDILDYSKIEAGEVQVESVVFNLKVGMEDALSLASHTASEKELDIKLSWGPAMPESVDSDPARLRQVVLNLLTNAIKFTHSGSVELRVTKERSVEDTVFVRFEVIDSGIGMSEEEQAQIFLSFRQANRSTNRLYGGSGLGLPICKNLVELLGGELRVLSEQGRGSTFYFTLPMKMPHPVDMREIREAPEEPEEMIAPDQVRLLLAEDNPVMQMMMVKVFKRLGLKVDLAHNGVEAVRAVLSNVYDLVFMDCEMPLKDGFQACREIRDAFQVSELPVIGVTAHLADTIRNQSTAAGMDEIITKPVTIDQLKDVLRRHLGLDL